MVDNAQTGGEPSGQAAPAEPPARPARASSLGSIINRIERAVDEETAAIRTDVGYDLKSSNARKSRYLYELNRAVKSPGAAAMIAEQQDAILRLREKLARNQDAILAHLNAVTEVAALIKGAIQRAEADGTYSAGEFASR
jgi:hypothetical protein